MKMKMYFSFSFSFSRSFGSDMHMAAVCMDEMNGFGDLLIPFFLLSLFFFPVWLWWSECFFIPTMQFNSIHFNPIRNEQPEAEYIDEGDAGDSEEDEEDQASDVAEEEEEEEEKKVKPKHPSTKSSSSSKPAADKKKPAKPAAKKKKKKSKEEEEDEDESGMDEDYEDEYYSDDLNEGSGEDEEEEEEDSGSSKKKEAKSKVKDSRPVCKYVRVFPSCLFSRTLLCFLCCCSFFFRFSRLFSSLLFRSQTVFRHVHFPIQCSVCFHSTCIQ